jgi:hypothetical protein
LNGSYYGCLIEILPFVLASCYHRYYSTGCLSGSYYASYLHSCFHSYYGYVPYY